MTALNGRTFPTPRSVRAALAARHGVPETTVRLHSLTDLSPGLGPAAVLRVIADIGGTGPTSLVVKVPAAGRRSLLDPRDPMLARREALFLRGDVPRALPAGIGVPPGARVVSHDGIEWIFMPDLGDALDRPWSAAAARTAARRTALLYVPGANDPALLDADWLERRGFNAYAHHVPAGHENLDALAGDSRLDGLFSADEVRRLHDCLDRLDELTARAGRLPPTLVHGDLHPRNAALGPDGTLLLIDWEHAGVGPVGHDLGTFVSVYRAFGGRGTLDERALLAAYGEALSAAAGTDLRQEATAGYAVTHLTWGLHLRLGPGLTAIRQGKHGITPEQLRPHLDDIRTGCRRALSWRPLLHPAARDPAGGTP